MTEKTKAIRQLEERMDRLEPGSLRHRVLECAKDFKSSWIELGRFLYSVHKDRLYRDWGFQDFEVYCAKEVGIRQATAVKMLRSYSFLEREEPAYARAEALSDRSPMQIPGYESVNALRLAKENPNLTPRQYGELRDEVFEGRKDDQEVKKKILYVLKGARPAAQTEAGADRDGALRRLHAQLLGAKHRLNELEVPSKIMKQIDALLELLEDYQK